MPEISREVQSLRSENTKTFDLGKGKRRLEAHIGAAHYRDNYADPGEAWKDIDLTWQGNRITKAPYELSREGNKITLKDKKTGEISTIERLSVKPAGLDFEVVPDLDLVKIRHTISSDEVPFEAKFRVTGKGPFRAIALDDEGELELETSLKNGILTEKLSVIKDKQLGCIRPAKGKIRVDPSWRVVGSTNDCRWIQVPNTWGTAVTAQDVGAHNGSNYRYGGGMRFQNVTIPGEAEITEAYLTLRAAGGFGSNCNTRISGDDTDDAATFGTQANFSTRWNARTTARVDWDAIAPWVPGSYYDSPDIKDIIQEIVDRGGWNSGQDIAIFWDDFDDRSPHAGNRKWAYSWDQSPGTAPLLVVTYTTVTGTGMEIQIH